MTFEDNCELFKAALSEAAVRGVTAACLIVESQAKLLAPVASGFMRDMTIDYKVSEKDTEVEGQVGSSAEYAPFVEYGTGEFAENSEGRKGGWAYVDEEGKGHFTLGNKPQPFLRPAFRANKENIKRVIGEEYGVTFEGDV